MSLNLGVTEAVKESPNGRLSRHPQKLAIRLDEAFGAVRSLAERPRVTPLNGKLAEEIVVNWTAEVIEERIGPTQKRQLRYLCANVPPCKNMTICRVRYPPANFLNCRRLAHTVRKFDLNCETVDCPVSEHHGKGTAEYGISISRDEHEVRVAPLNFSAYGR